MIPITTLVHEVARVFGPKPAIISDRWTVTYEELDERINRLANSYRELGLQHGDRFAVMATDSIEHVETALAICRAGGVYVPLNYRLREEEVGYLLSDSDPVLLAVDPEYLDIARAVRQKVTSVQHVVVFGEASDDVLAHDDVVGRGAPTYPSVELRPDDVVQIQYSSGTTGLPKGAVLTHHTLSSRTAIGLVESGRFASDISFHNAPFFHVAGSQLDYSVLVKGGTVLRHRQFDAERAADALQDLKVTSAFFVPSMINALLQVPGIAEHDFSSLRLIEYGAAPMPQAQLRSGIDIFGCSFVQLFGAGTEGGMQAILPAEDHIVGGTDVQTRRLSSIGRPTAFTEVRVVNEDGHPVNPGEIGEIISRGPANMREYWGKPEATAETLRDGWLHAGDMATVDEDGYLYLVDRKKDMIIRGGENIYPTEIELALCEHPSVLEAAVIGVPDDHWGENVHAIVVTRPGETLTGDDVIEFCRQRLASYKKPATVEFVDALPRNASGKILKRELREPFWKDAGRSI